MAACTSTFPDDHRPAPGVPSATSPRSEVAPAAEELDRDEALPVRDRAKMGELGWMGILFPEEVGGAGARRSQYALAVEELTRVDSSRRHHDVRAHVARHAADLPVRLRRAEGARWLPDLCARAQARRVRPDRARCGLGRRQLRTRAALDGRRLGDQRRQEFITNAGTDISGMSRSPPAPARARSPTSSSRRARPATSRAALRKMGWNAPDTRPLTFDGLPRARGAPARPARRRASGSSCTSSTSAASASPRWASASPRARSTRRWPTPRSAAPSASRSRSSRPSSSSSPTWRPRSRPRAC